MESDHKPLEMIHQKSLASMPPRFQRMLLQLQWYNVTIRYKPGKDMLFADALSRCPSWTSGEINLDMRVDYIAFNKTWIAKLNEAIQEDPILSTVYQLTQQGWSHQRIHTLWMARAHWDSRHELSIDEGLLLKGPHIVIPSCLHEEYLETSPWPPFSYQGSTECLLTFLLTWLGCRHTGLHEKMPGMCPKITPSQRVTTSSWCVTAALGTHSNGSLLCE